MARLLYSKEKRTHESMPLLVAELILSAFKSHNCKFSSTITVTLMVKHYCFNAHCAQANVFRNYLF